MSAAAIIYSEEFMHSSKLNVFLLASRPISTLIISLSIHSSIIWKLKKIVSKMYSCSPQEKNSCWLDFLRNGFRDEWCQLIKKLSHSSLYLQIWILKLSSQTDTYQNIQVAFYWNIWAEKINFQCKNYVNLLWKYYEILPLIKTSCCWHVEPLFQNFPQTFLQLIVKGRDTGLDFMLSKKMARPINWGGGTLGGEEEGGAVTFFYQGFLFSTSRELWFGQQLCLGARLQLGGLGGDEMKESESFIMIIVCLVGSFIVSAWYGLVAKVLAE